MRHLVAACTLALVFAPAAPAHEGHGHADASAPAGQAEPTATDALTGSGELRFRYNRGLSVLPPEIAAGIAKAHGGFAKAPTGEVYFGLNGTGVIRLSADLRTMTLLPASRALATGGLHNTTYLGRDGGRLVIPDNAGGRVRVVTLEGEEVAALGRPGVNDYYRDAANAYRPTDTAVTPDGLLCICDGYSPGKYVLTADLDTMAYGQRFFGGPVPGGGRTPGRFSTNHGVTYDPADRTLAIADRERQWVQKFDLDGGFVRGFETGGNPCDVDFVEWRGEPLTVVGCLRGEGDTAGVVQLLRGDRLVATLRPKADLGLASFEHIHNAAGVVVDGGLYVLCYGWNPGCYAVLERVSE